MKVYRQSGGRSDRSDANHVWRTYRKLLRECVSQKLKLHMLCDLESRKRNAVGEQPSRDTERGVLTLLRLMPLLREVDVAPCADNVHEIAKDT